MVLEALLFSGLVERGEGYLRTLRLETSSGVAVNLKGVLCECLRGVF
jgi:hypothetical protein